MDSTLFYGAHTALITPFYRNEPCLSCLSQLIDYQVENGINGLVALGTTAESPTLTTTEKDTLLRHTLEATAGRVPVIAGCGSADTATSVELAQKYSALEIAALLSVTPYYNKPSQEGLFHHFSAIASATEKPILLYSVPSRCGIEIAPETAARLHEKHPNICGLKEASSSTARISRFRQLLGDAFVLLSGDDAQTLPFLSLGAKGVISVASNVVPAAMSKLVHEALNNRFLEAEKIHHQYFPLFQTLFIESNPVPVKEALAFMGIIQSPEVRLPLYGLKPENRNTLAQRLAQLGLVPEYANA